MAAGPPLAPAGRWRRRPRRPSSSRSRRRASTWTRPTVHLERRRPSAGAARERAAAGRLRRQAPLPGALPAARRRRRLRHLGEAGARRHRADGRRASPGIIVMPEGDRGFYTNWWNDGRRADPGWERYDLEELIPLVERKFRIRKARRWHAIAGLSMGGMGTMYLASQRPHYFGSAASFSGFVSHQGPGVDLGLRPGRRRRLRADLRPAGRLLRHRPQPVAAHRQPAPHAPVRDGRRRHAGGGQVNPAAAAARGRR